MQADSANANSKMQYAFLISDTYGSPVSTNGTLFYAQNLFCENGIDLANITAGFATIWSSVNSGSTNAGSTETCCHGLGFRGQPGCSLPG